uniref:Uncharacterized protein n=1 Tax=Anguilla anguilla TaxID=7936 RepID=A0A0E9T089_ANGAN
MTPKNVHHSENRNMKSNALGSYFSVSVFLNTSTYSLKNKLCLSSIFFLFVSVMTPPSQK